MTATHLPSSRDLDGFRAAQRLAYACAEAIHAELKPGVTEREVAARMKNGLPIMVPSIACTSPLCGLVNAPPFVA